MLTLNAPLSKGKFLGLMTAGLASATLGLAASPAQALTQFAGDYAPANWTQSIGGRWLDRYWWLPQQALS